MTSRLVLVELVEKSEQEPLAMSSSSEAASTPFTEASPSNLDCRGEDHHHHIHGPLDRSKALGIGSLSFEPIFNEKYNATG
eukprot:s881_g3.t1